MIELRGLHLGNIARSPAESVRPDLWPDHAWVPALGCTGGSLYDLCGQNHGALMGSTTWATGRTVHDADGEYIACGNIDTAQLAGGFTVFARMIFSSSQIDTYPALLSAWGTGTSCFNIGAMLDPKKLYSEARNTADSSSYYRYWASALPSSTPVSIATVVSGSAYPDNYLDGRTDNGTTSGVPAGILAKISPLEIARQNASPTLTMFMGQIGIVTLTARRLVPAQIFDLTADPLLPFRRRQPVFYSVPSGGGSIETPAAIMMAL